MYAVILAGGGGTRLWPLSRPEVPKPFLPLLGARTLLQLTVDRLVDHEPELRLRREDVAVVTDRRYEALVAAQLPGARIVVEPIGRNTAAAVALAALALDRPEDEVMLVLPADHLIRNEPVYRGVLAGAADLAARGPFGIDRPLITLGIEVDRPATEYGYLIPDLARGASLRGLTAYPLLGFEEKPGRARALQLLEQPGAAWNAGIFVWQRGAILGALERYTRLVDLLEPALEPAALEAAYARLQPDAADLRPESIDVAVMEEAARDHQVVMAAMDVGWSDLGGWTALLAAIEAEGTGRVVQAGEPAEAMEGDLVVERVDGRLVLADGPRGILAPGPVALLSGAGRSRAQVEALLGRVARQEVRL